MKKKVCTLTLIFLLLSMVILTTQGVYADEPVELSIDIPKTVDAGDAFDVKVLIQEESGVAACSFNLLYDSDMFFCTGYNCVLLPNGTTTVNLNYGVGKIRISSINSSELSDGGELIVFHFQAKPSAFSSGYISLDKIIIANENGSLLDSNTYTSKNMMVNPYIPIPIEVSGSDSSVFQYEENEIGVSIGEAKDVCGGEIKINYDCSVISSIKVEHSNLLDDYVIEQNITNTSIYLGWMGSDSLSNSGELFHISFVVNKEPVDNAIQIERILLVDKYGNNIPHSIVTSGLEFEIVQCPISVLTESINPTEATLKISGTPNGYVAASFFTPNGQMIASTMEKTSRQDIIISLNSAFDLTKCTWKIFCLNTRFMPICTYQSTD